MFPEAPGGRHPPAGQRQGLERLPAARVLAAVRPAASARANRLLHHVAAGMQGGGGGRGTERAFFHTHTGEPYLYCAEPKPLGQTAPFRSGSIVPALRCACSFYRRSSACWDGMTRRLEVNFKLK